VPLSDEPGAVVPQTNLVGTTDDLISDIRPWAPNPTDDGVTLVAEVLKI
jgi:hypothetical protein